MSATGAPTQPAPAPAAAGPSAIAGAPTTPAELLTHAYPPVFSGVAADSGLSAVAAAHNPRPTITFRPNRVMVLDIVFPFRVGGLRRNYTSVRPDTVGESGVYRTVAKRCCPGYSRYRARRRATQGRAVTRHATNSQRPTGHRRSVLISARQRTRKALRSRRCCHFKPAASMPRSSFLRSAISSRRRAASSN